MNKEKETHMRKTIFAIAAAAMLASSTAWAATITCQPLGNATVCSGRDDSRSHQDISDGDRLIDQ